MKYSILFFLSFFLFLPDVVAQQASKSMEEFAKTIKPEDLRAHLEFLSDDLLEGRETGTRGIELAALYLKSQFQKIGLAPGVPAENSYFQYYQLVDKFIRSLSIKVGKATFSYPDDFMSFSVGNIPAELKGDLTFAGYAYSFEPEKLPASSYEGKIAVAIAESRTLGEKDFRARRGQLRKLSAHLKAQGARGLIIIQGEVAYERYRKMAGLKSLSTKNVDEVPFPIFYASPGMGGTLLRPARSSVAKIKKAVKNTGDYPDLNFSKVKWSYSADLDMTSVRPSNVLGYLEGTDKKEELIVFTAHYDHEGVKNNGKDIYNGADDDGSGTSTIVELAEAFALAAQSGYRPRRSLLFMAVSGEEKGLLGSGFYAEHPVFPLENTVANLNIDMIGRTDRNYEGKEDSARYVYIIGSDRLSTDLHEINEQMNTEFANLVLDYRYNAESDPNRFYERSDHYNFAKKGVPIIFYFTGVHRDYHKPTDTVDKINFEKITRIARLIFATGWELANRDERITVDQSESEN